MKLKDTLGATLLALADRRWTLNRLLRLQPTVDQHWPWWAVVLRAAIWGLLLGGALYGMTTGLAGSNPRGWTFVWGFWMGLGCSATWQALTALAWNRRAAQLAGGSDSGSSERLPWWLRWLLGPAYVLLLGMALPIVLVVSVANIRAKLAWERYRAELVADGVKMTVEDLLPGTIPDEENVAMAPFFAPMLPVFAHGGPTRQSDWDRIRETIHSAHLPAGVNRDLGIVAFKQRPLDPAALQQAFRADKKFTNAVAAADSAEGLLETLRYADPQLALLREALERPHARFPISYEDNFSALLPHLAPMKGLAETLAARAGARVRVGKGAAALEDTLAILRLADVMEEEPLLISCLVSYAVRGVGYGPIWEGLKGRVWTKAELERLEAALAASDVEGAMRRGWEGERLLATDGLLEVAEKPTKLGMFTEISTGAAFPTAPVRFGRFVIYRNVVRLNRYSDVITGRRPNDPATRAAKRDLEGMLERSSDSAVLPRMDGGEGIRNPSRILADQVFPAVSTATNKTLRVLAELHVVRTAVALERFRMAKGVYPAALTELKPAYLAEALLDPYTGEPFRYERSADGRFRLWSLGINRRDDGGVLGAKAYAKDTPAAEPDDLCWAYEPVATK
jgi:hypothetical protein